MCPRRALVPSPPDPQRERLPAGSGPDTHPSEIVCQIFFPDHSVLWALTTDRQPKGMGVGGGNFPGDSPATPRAVNTPCGVRSQLCAQDVSSTGCFPACHHGGLGRGCCVFSPLHPLPLGKEAPGPVLYPSVSVEGAQPALGLLWGADVLEMVRGWGRGGGIAQLHGPTPSSGAAFLGNSRKQRHTCQD